MELKFVTEVPAPKHGSVGVNKARVQALAERLGEWALIATYKHQGAGAARNGLSATAAKLGYAIEIVSRGKDLYARVTGKL